MTFVVGEPVLIPTGELSDLYYSLQLDEIGLLLQVIEEWKAGEPKELFLVQRWPGIMARLDRRTFVCFSHDSTQLLLSELQKIPTFVSSDSIYAEHFPDGTPFHFDCSPTNEPGGYLFMPASADTSVRIYLREVADVAVWMTSASVLKEKTATEVEHEGDEGDEWEYEHRDVNLVVDQVDCTREEAIRGLENMHGNIVDAIMWLMEDGGMASRKHRRYLEESPFAFRHG